MSGIRWILRFLGLAAFCVGPFVTSRGVEGAPAAESPIEITLPDGTVASLAFWAEPALEDCRQADTGEDWRLYRCSDYSLELRIAREHDAHLVSFILQNTDGEPFRLQESGASVVAPYSNEDALFSFNRRPLWDIMESNLARPWEYFTAANRGIPYAALVDGHGNVKLALGLIAQKNAVVVRGNLSDGNKSYTLTLRHIDSATAPLFEGAFYISRAGDLWFRNAQAYTASVDRSRNYIPPPLPEGVFDPGYDSWYWSQDRIDQNLVWDLAVRCRELGIKTYLLDSGWDTKAGEYFKWLHGSTGDYSPPKDTFPDLPGLLDRIRNQLGMRIMLWLQQYALGRRSVYYRKIGSALSSFPFGETGEYYETPALCPRVYATRQHMIDLFGRIMNDYRPEAFWLDWQEELPVFCGAPHYHEEESFGEGYNATQQLIMDLIRERSPDIFVEMRWPYANLNNKPYTHLWQPIDSPRDYEAMRLQAMVMRPFSAGVAMGTDEMYWDPGITDDEAARFMAATVFSGVPYFGHNLLAEPAARTDMLKSWIRFYEENKEDLVYGDFSPWGDRDQPNQLIEGKGVAFLYYGSPSSQMPSLTKEADRLHIVNGSRTTLVDLLISGLKGGNYRVDLSNSLLRYTRAPAIVSLGTTGRIRFNVPVGCLLTLTLMP